MSLTRIPLPSIALVLSSDPTALPSRPSVIKFEFDPLQTIHPTSFGSSPVVHPIEAQIDPTGVQTDQYANQSVVDERFFFRNDSSTDVNTDNEPLDDESDTQTVFADKRPTTSRGSMSKGLKSEIVLKGNFMAFASTIHSLLLQFKLKGSAMNKSAQVTKVVVVEQ